MRDLASRNSLVDNLFSCHPTTQTNYQHCINLTLFIFNVFRAKVSHKKRSYFAFSCGSSFTRRVSFVRILILLGIACFHVAVRITEAFNSTCVHIRHESLYVYFQSVDSEQELGTPDGLGKNCNLWH